MRLTGRHWPAENFNPKKVADPRYEPKKGSATSSCFGKIDLILRQSSPVGQPNAHLVAKQVLNGHDAADLALAAIADQQGKLAARVEFPS